MKIRDFKRHTITSSTPPHFDNCALYRPYLKSDFSNRCAYCNLHDQSITTPFEIDHFIPRKEFTGKRDELLTDYHNLVYSCKKCNIAKSSKFSGDLTLSTPTNTLFYHPVDTDYNTIFFRNELGAIDSDDKKGREMIGLLKLYRPIHILGWLCEELSATIDRLQDAISVEKDGDRKKLLEQAKSKLDSQYVRYSRLFIASYNDPSFAIEEVMQPIG